MVRNGYHKPREVTTAAGAVQVIAPRVNDKRSDSETGQRQRFSSAILPPWARATKRFAVAYGAKIPKAVAKITDDLEPLLAFYNYPAEHWIHLRTTNPIESTFATVRHRSKITKGPGSRAAGIAMVFKLIHEVQARYRAVNAPHLVALVRAGAPRRHRCHRRRRVENRNHIPAVDAVIMIQ